MGVTTAELNKMLENGEVMSEEFLPKFAKELRNTFEATPELLNGPQQAINRMKNAFVEAAMAFGDAGFNEFIIKMSDSLTQVAESDAFLNTLETAGSLLVTLADNIDSVVYAFEVLGTVLLAKTIANTATDVLALSKGFKGATTEALGLRGVMSNLAVLSGAAVAGFNLGRIMADQFVWARQAGTFLVEGLLTTWEILKSKTKLTFTELGIDIVNPVKKAFGQILQSAAGFYDGLARGAQTLRLDDLEKKYKDAANSVRTFGEEIENNAIEQNKKDVADLNAEITSLDKKLAFINETFADQRKTLEEQAKAAKKAGLSIGDYIAQQDKAIKAALAKANADAKAAKRTKELSKAEKELAVQQAKAAKVKALKDFEDLGEKYDKQTKALNEQKEALDELWKIYDTGAISGAQFLEVQEIIKKSFEDTLNPVAGIESEILNLEKAYSTFSDSVRAEAMFKALQKGFGEDTAEAVAEATKRLEEFKEKLEEAAKIEDFDILENLGDNLISGFDSIASGLGDSIGNGLITGEWDGIGRQIGGALSGALGDTLGTGVTSALTGALGAAAGPIGSLVGSLAGSLLGGLFSSNEAPDRTEERMKAQGTGTVLGDIKAQSQSIAKSIELVAETNADIVNINTKMLNALSGTEKAIGAFTTDFFESQFSEIQGLTSKGVREEATRQSYGINLDPESLQSRVAAEAVKQVGTGRIRLSDVGIKLLGGQLADLLDETGEGAIASAYISLTKGGSSKSGEVLLSLGEEQETKFREVLQGVADTVSVGAEMLGASQEQIDAAVANLGVEELNLSLENLNLEDATEQINTAVSKVFDGLVTTTLPWLEAMGRGGEGLGETLARVSTEFELAKEASLVLGFSVASSLGDMVGNAINVDSALGSAMSKLPVPVELMVQAADDLVQKTGGIEAFSQALLGYEANFLSSSEQLENQGRRLTEALGDLGLPETRQGFVDLMEAQEALDGSGRENIATLLKLQGQADAYYDALEKGTQSADLDALANRLLDLGSAEDQALAASNRLATSREEELAALEGLSNADQAKELLLQIYDLEDAAGAAGEAVGDLSAELQSMVSAAVDAFYEISFAAFNLDGSALTGGQIEQASSALVNGVGDINSFNAAVTSFSNNFISSEAKFTSSANALQAAADKYGATIPQTRQGFADILQAQNAMTEGGQDVISTMLSITDEANTYYGYIEAQEARKFDLENRLYTLQGKELLVLSRTRQKEIDSATDSEKAILRQIHAAEDATKAMEEQIEKEAELTSQVADVQERINDAYRDQISLVQDTANTMRGLSDSLLGFGSDLALGSLSALSPQEQLALARSDFESTASAAQAGDIGALERLQGVATAFLEESREFQGSGGTFAQDFAQVQEVISNSATVADIQADQAERQAMLMERQLLRQEEQNEETRSIKEALLALIAVQRESGILSLSQLEAMKTSLAILESNSSLEASQL